MGGTSSGQLWWLGNAWYGYHHGLDGVIRLTSLSFRRRKLKPTSRSSNCRQRRRHARDAQWRAVSGRFLDGPRAKQSHSFRPFVRPSVRRTTTKAKKTCAKNMAHSSTSFSGHRRMAVRHTYTLRHPLYCCCCYCFCYWLCTALARAAVVTPPSPPSVQKESVPLHTTYNQAAIERAPKISSFFQALLPVAALPTKRPLWPSSGDDGGCMERKTPDERY